MIRNGNDTIFAMFQYFNSDSLNYPFKVGLENYVFYNYEHFKSNCKYKCCLENNEFSVKHYCASHLGISHQALLRLIQNTIHNFPNTTFYKEKIYINFGYTYKM
jgi:hypothetical protein